MLRIATLLLALLCIIPGIAVGACTQKAPTVTDFEKATAMGLKLYRELEASQAQVAFVGRVGSDLSKYGFKYSHMGVVVKNHPKGRWLFTHLLNHCGSSESALYDEGVITFFTDNPFAYEAIIVIPKKEIQVAISKALKEGWGDRFHEERYSTIANPFSTDYQNSNQWLLELIAATNSFYYSAKDRQAAQKVLQQTSYQPDYVNVPPGMRLGAALFRNNVRFDDHTRQSRQTGQFPLVTVRSIVRYLNHMGAVSSMKEIKLEAGDVERLVRNKSNAPATVNKVDTAPIQKPVPVSAQGANPDVNGFWTR